MPEKDKPMWPSADEDTASGGPREQGGDGGATAHLPVPDVTPPANANGETQELTVPKITHSEQQMSWFQPAKPVSQPPPHPPQRRPEPQRPQQRPEQQRPEQRQTPPQPELLRRLSQIPAAPHAVPMRIEPSGEQHLAEATTGVDRPPSRQPDDVSEPAEFAEPTDPPKPVDPPKPAKPKRKRRGLLIGALAFLLVVATGVSAALPQVSNRLQLPWAPNKPKGDAPQPAVVTLALHGPEASAPAPSGDGVPPPATPRPGRKADPSGSRRRTLPATADSPGQPALPYKRCGMFAASVRWYVPVVGWDSAPPRCLSR